MVYCVTHLETSHGLSTVTPMLLLEKEQFPRFPFKHSSTYFIPKPQPHLGSNLVMKLINSICLDFYSSLFWTFKIRFWPYDQKSNAQCSQTHQNHGCREEEEARSRYPQELHHSTVENRDGKSETAGLLY